MSCKLEFDKGYLYAKGEIVENIVKKWLSKINSSHPLILFIKNRQNRDGGIKHHITVITTSEYKLYRKNGGKSIREELLEKEIAFDDIKDFGIGCVKTKGDSHHVMKAWFVIVDSKFINEYRKMLGLPKKDLHITVSFTDFDIHDVDKGLKTLIFSNEFEEEKVVEELDSLGKDEEKSVEVNKVQGILTSNNKEKSKINKIKDQIKERVLECSFLILPSMYKIPFHLKQASQKAEGEKVIIIKKAADFFDFLDGQLKTKKGIAASAQCILQFVIQGSDNYVVDLKHGEGSVKKGLDPTADCTFTYKSEEDFIAINNKTLTFPRAMWERKLIISGDLMKAKALARIFTSGGGNESKKGGSGEWVDDNSVSACTTCSRSFDWFLRKHHCRTCGLIYCDRCVPRRLYEIKSSSNGRNMFIERRACASCHNEYLTKQNNGQIKDASAPEDFDEKSKLATKLLSNKVEELNNKVMKLELLNQTTPSYFATFFLFMFPYVGHTFAAAYCFKSFYDLCNFFYLYDSFSLLEMSFSLSLFLWVFLSYLTFLAILNLDYFYLLRRRLDLYGISFYIYVGYKMTQRRAEHLDSEYADALWESTNRFYAFTIYHNLLAKKGLWIKTGQYLGTRADTMPPAFIKEFSKLQDAVKPSPFEHIRETIEQDLGKPINEIFSNFEEVPLAAASIGQVHKATLKEGGKNVVVKVQHKGIKELLDADCVILGKIMSWVAWADPKFDFKPVLEEWSKEVSKETNFINEGLNAKEIKDNLSKTDIDIYIPFTYTNMTTNRVMVMEYVDGVKVTNTDILAEWRADKESLVGAMSDSIWNQIFINGVFHGDPHPGNILIRQHNSSPNGCQVVLLDFGLVKRLPNNLRLAFSKMVVAASQLDFGLLLESHEDMGLKLSREDNRDMIGALFFFRDTAPAAESRAAHRKNRNELIKIRNESKVQKNPVDAWPVEFIFFARSIELLGGVATQLGVRSARLSSMTTFATKALRDQFGVEENKVNKCIDMFPAAPSSMLQVKVRETVAKMLQSPSFLGLSICVMEKEEIVLNISAGSRGLLDPRPLKNSTQFNLFGISSGIILLALSTLEKEGKLSRNSSISTYWPEFGTFGKEIITIRDLLNFNTGLEFCLPENFNTRELCDWESLIKFALNISLPLQKNAGSINEDSSNKNNSPLHYSLTHLQITWGVISGALIEKVTKKSLRESILSMFPDIKDLSYSLNQDEVYIFDLASVALAAADNAGSAPMLVAQVTEMALSNPNLESYRGKESLLDPRLFNARKIRSARIPSSNIHGSASAVCKVFDKFRKSKIEVPSSLDSFPFKSISTGSQSLLYGSRGAGGNIVLVDPVRHLVVCVLCNEISGGPSSAVQILEVILQEYNLVSKMENIY